METVGLFEAKNRLSELVARASRGQKIGITRHGKLSALIVPAEPQETLEDIFRNIERIRKRAKLPRGVSVKDLIEEGRM
jgi:prevent-host-death family protein